MDQPGGNGHPPTGLLYELAEFDFIDLHKEVPLEHFHFSQERAVFEIAWRGFGLDVELCVHIEPRNPEKG